MKPKNQMDGGIGGLLVAGLGASAINAGGNTKRGNPSQSELTTERYRAAVHEGPGHSVILNTITTAIVGLIMFFIAISPTYGSSMPEWVPSWYANFVQDPLWGTILLAFFGLCAIAAAITMYTIITPFIGMNMRLRFWSVGSKEALASGDFTGMPYLDLLFMIPLKTVAFFGLVFPFILLDNTYELIKSITLNLLGKTYWAKGGLSIYYIRTQREYAEVYAQKGKAAAIQFLCKAYSGVFTSRTKMLQPHELTEEMNAALTHEMIHKYGPINKYVAGAQENAATERKMTIDDKGYDVI